MLKVAKGPNKIKQLVHRILCYIYFSNLIEIFFEIFRLWKICACRKFQKFSPKFLFIFCLTTLDNFFLFQIFSQNFSHFMLFIQQKNYGKGLIKFFTKNYKLWNFSIFRANLWGSFYQKMINFLDFLNHFWKCFFRKKSSFRQNPLIFSIFRPPNFKSCDAKIFCFEFFPNLPLRCQCWRIGPWPWSTWLLVPGFADQPPHRIPEKWAIALKIKGLCLIYKNKKSFFIPFILLSNFHENS